MPREQLRSVPTHPLPQDRPFEDAARDTIAQWREDLLGFHDDALAEDGGLPGIRDEAALAAAALFKAVAQYHAFVDGNKRTAFIAVLYFLWNCGYWPHALLLSRQELDRLEYLTLWISCEREDREAGASPEAYEIPHVARWLDQILRPSRRKRGRSARLHSGGFRLVIER